MDRKSELLIAAQENAELKISGETGEEITRALLDRGAADRRLACGELYDVWAW